MSLKASLNDFGAISLVWLPVFSVRSANIPTWSPGHTEKDQDMPAVTHLLSTTYGLHSPPLIKGGRELANDDHLALKDHVDVR